MTNINNIAFTASKVNKILNNKDDIKPIETSQTVENNPEDKKTASKGHFLSRIFHLGKDETKKEFEELFKFADKQEQIAVNWFIMAQKLDDGDKQKTLAYSKTKFHLNKAIKSIKEKEDEVFNDKSLTDINLIRKKLNILNRKEYDLKATLSKVLTHKNKLNSSKEAIQQTNKINNIRAELFYTGGTDFFRDTFLDGVEYGAFKYTPNGELITAEDISDYAYTVLIDFSKDKSLQNCLSKANSIFNNLEKEIKNKNITNQEKIDIKKLQTLMEFISSQFNINEYIDMPDKDNPDNTKHLPRGLFQQMHLPKRRIMLGEFLSGSDDGLKPGYGTCQTTSLFAKAIAEKMDKPLYLDLGVGIHHLWNEFVSIDGKKYIFDPINQLILIPEDNKMLIYHKDTDEWALGTQKQREIVNKELYKNFYNLH